MADIVNQLREAGYRVRQIPVPFGPRLFSMEKQEFIPHNTPCLHDKAADAIELLNTELAEAQAEIQRQRMDGSGAAMSDLVEQLRGAGYRFRQVPEPFGPWRFSMEKQDFIPHDKPCLYDKAADEIERLQAEIQRLTGETDA